MRATQLSSHSGKRALSCPAGGGTVRQRGTTSHMKYEELEDDSKHSMPGGSIFVSVTVDA